MEDNILGEKYLLKLRKYIEIGCAIKVSQSVSNYSSQVVKLVLVSETIYLYLWSSRMVERTDKSRFREHFNRKIRSTFPSLSSVSMMPVFLPPTACPHYLGEVKPLLALILTCSFPYVKTDRCLMNQAP